MRKDLLKISRTVVLMIVFIGIISASSVTAMNAGWTSRNIGIQYQNQLSLQSLSYIDITVEEAWDFLTDPTNGIQRPIDVRTYNEWYEERIDTPFPEEPKRHSDFSDNGVKEFIATYNGTDVVLYCLAGGRSSSAAQVLAGSTYNGTIYNMVGGITEWKAHGYPTKKSNQPPRAPDTPSGPTVAVVGIASTFITVATDPNNDTVKYGWSWDGDDIIEEFTTYYPSGTLMSTSHMWLQPGQYEVKVKAVDNVGEESDFSDIFSIQVTQPPNPPIIEGETSGKSGVEYEYSFTVVDLDLDDLYVFIDWGDGELEEWIGPYTSGQTITVSHSWTTDGTYLIKAKTKDVYSAESDWATLTVTMPYSYNKLIVQFLGWLFQRFSYAFPILRPSLGY